MLIPSESFGRHFIVFSLEGRKTVSYYLITASQDHTVVNIRLAAQSQVLPEVTLNERDTKKYNLLNAYIASSKGVQVAIVQASACIGAQRSDVGDPSLCLLVPMGLFFNKYVW
ncbi:multiple epidermal growth factor domains protein 11, partial [Biomphalaria glabrata]